MAKNLAKVFINFVFGSNRPGVLLAFRQLNFLVKFCFDKFQEKLHRVTQPAISPNLATVCYNKCWNVHKV